MSVNNELNGRLALITGASGGIGAACAHSLYQKGVHLALTYSKNVSGVQDLLTSLQSSASTNSTIQISTHQVDMGSEDDLHRLFKEIEEQHGHGPDILIANAGHGKRIVNILDIPLEEFDYTLSINLRAPFLLSKLSVPHMASQKWGRIIYMGSIAGYGGGVNGCHYAASKAGLMGMAKNLALKLAGDGITVNDVAPAMIGDTGMIPNAEVLVGTPGDVRNIPVGRLGTPGEVANVVTMLCETGYLTGQSIVLSGGLNSLMQGFSLAHDTQQSLFEYLAARPAKAKEFISAMKSFSTGIPANSPDFLVHGYPWKLLGNGTVVDIGGSEGHISSQLAQNFPALSFIVQDHPEVIQGAAAKIEPSIAQRVSYGLAKSNSHLYAVPGLRTCSSLLESTEPTGALVITDTLPSTSVARRDFPLPTSHRGLLNLRAERIGEALGGTATRRNTALKDV